MNSCPLRLSRIEWRHPQRNYAANPPETQFSQRKRTGEEAEQEMTLFSIAQDQLMKSKKVCLLKSPPTQLPSNRPTGNFEIYSNWITMPWELQLKRARNVWEIIKKWTMLLTVCVITEKWASLQKQTYNTLQHIKHWKADVPSIHFFQQNMFEKRQK